jgi:hypothetical protein
MPPQSRLLLQRVALIVLTALVFWPGLGGDFLFDDYPNIVTNPKVHLDAIDAEGLRQAAAAYEPGPLGRPVATLSFALNHLVGGLEPWGYKFGNLLVHLLNALLVLALVRRVLTLARVDSDVVPSAAFAVALLWAIHPLQVSSVLYVVQRMETLSVTFTLATLLAYLAGRTRQARGERGWPWLLACVPLALLALLSKESGALLPAYALALELAQLKFASTTPARTAALRWLYAVAVAASAVFFVAVVLPPYLDPAAYALREFTLAERLLSQPRVLCLYVQQMLLPAPGTMTFYYDTYPVSRGLLQPVSTLVCSVLLAGWIGIAWWKRAVAPLFLLGTLWFFASHLLTSNVLPLEVAFEHRNYFALLGVALCVADIVLRIPHGEIPRMRAATVGIVVVGLCLLTLLRAATWGNPTTLALDLAAKNPQSSRASVDLGEQFMRLANGDATSPYYERAEAEFERGAALEASSPLPEQALILLASSAKVPAKDAWWLSFIAKIESRPIGPQELMAVTGMLQQRDHLSRFDDRRFRQLMDALIARRTLEPYLLATYGDYLLAHHQDRAAATDAFRAAAAGSKAQPDFVVAMVSNLVAEGYPEIGKSVLDEADRHDIPLPAGFSLELAPNALPQGEQDDGLE